VSRSRKNLGKFGERVAAQYLSNKGYRILENNYTCPLGELDLIAEKGNRLIFIEVRTRRGSSFGRAEETIGREKQKRVRRLAQYYLAAAGCEERAVQFDIVAVQVHIGKGCVEEIRHLECAF